LAEPVEASVKSERYLRKLQSLSRLNTYSFTHHTSTSSVTWIIAWLST